MSLRLRLFLLIGGLVALLVLAQWWLARLLTRDLSSELDAVVQTVGKSVVALLGHPGLEEGETPHGAVVRCVGDDCEKLDFTRHLRRFESGEEAIEDVEGKVLVERFVETPKSGEKAPEADPEAGHSYAYRFEKRLLAEDDSEPPDHTLEHVKIHVEHEGGARYLWMGVPHLSRRIQIPHRGFSERLEIFSRHLVLGTLGLLTVGLILAGVVAHRVTAPLRQLAGAARLLGEGALGTQVPVRVEGEVGEAIGAFNRMSSQLAELDARARAADAHKHLGEIGEIARALAHTLRNPLNALGLSVDELAARAGAEDAGRELAESARRQIRRIDQSIRSFLALASQSGGVLGEIDLGELIEDVGLEALQDGRGKVRLEIEVAEGLPHLRGVEPELRAVLQALVINAVEASAEGGRVTVRAMSPAAGRVRIEIDDDGPGLAPQVRQRLFTPHLSTKANGSGMGLFLAHRIATSRYGGSLELADRDPAERGPAERDGEPGGTRVCLELGERERSLSEGGDE